MNKPSTLYSNSHVILLIIIAGVSIELDTPRLQFAIMLGFAGCYGIYDTGLVSKKILLLIVLYASFLTGYLHQVVQEHGYTITEVFFIEEHLISAGKKAVTGLYILSIGAVYIILNLCLEKLQPTRTSKRN